jgi:hypothetical protein
MNPQKVWSEVWRWTKIVQDLVQRWGFLKRGIQFWCSTIKEGVRGSVVGWGTTLQAGRSRDRIPDEVDFFNLPKPSSRTMALGSTQPLTEMSTRNLPGGEGRPARKADNLTAICEPIVYKMWEPQHLTAIWVSTARYRDSFTFTIKDIVVRNREKQCQKFWLSCVET